MIGDSWLDAANLLQTKLNRPRLGPGMVLRQRLLDRFEGASNQPVILVSAPAGYGKTTVVNLWLEAIPQPYAWLSLDEQDSSLAGFAAYLVAALRTAYPEAGGGLSALLAGPSDAQPEVLANLFLNELGALGGPLVLVLDDYHWIHNLDVQAFMARVVQRVPSGVQLVLISRSDPPIGLARMRGRGQVVEFRSPDLRFRRAEAKELVQRLLEDAVTDEVIELLHERTEGWPVGLQLTALALRESEDRLAFAQRVAQSSHRPVMDYLLDEVLGQINQEQYELLLRASLLDRFSAPLWEVLAEEGSEASAQSKDLLDLAWQSNLFLVALDAEGVWYRYHHLLGDLLRRQLNRRVPAETLADLHRRVSVWFEQQGFLDEAIDHAVRAGDVDRAARLVESNINAALNREDWRLLERWLGLLPETALQRPGLLMVQAYLEHFHFNLGGLEQLLERARAALTANTWNYSEREITQLRGNVHLLRSHVFLSRSAEERLRQAELAMQFLAPDARFAHSQAEMFYAINLHQTGRTKEALDFLAARLQRQTGQPDTRTFRMHVGLLGIHYDLADLGSLEATSMTLLQMSQAEKHQLSAAWALFMFGWIHYQRNELNPAAAYFSRGIDVRFASNAKAAIDCHVGLALTQQAQKRPKAAAQTARELRKYLGEFDLFRLAGTADALDLYLNLGREARPGLGGQWRVPAGFTFAPEAQLAADLWMPPVLVAVRAYLASGTGDSLTSAWDLLQQCRQHAKSRNNRRRLIEIGALETLLHGARAEQGAAFKVLRESILLAETGGALRLIADAGPGLRPYLQQLRDQGVAPSYVTRVLAACRERETKPDPTLPQVALLAPPSASPGMVADLTGRELEVLQLLARGLTNKEIAAELIVSPNTVKKHTSNLYQKLHVPNRRRAVRVARALGYLSHDQ